MKAFMEEYGLIVVVACVILIILAAATGIGQDIVDAIKKTIDLFLDRVESLDSNVTTEGANGTAVVE